MTLSREKFEEIVAEALDELPERFREKLHNVAVFVEDFPSAEQMAEMGLRSKWGLLGLFEGYAQSRRLNFGPVLPDRITIFRQPIMKSCSDEQTCLSRIKKVVRHEIAHHFGMDERGARKAERQ